MRKRSWFAIGLAALAAVIAVGALTAPTPAPAQGEVYSVWLVESSRFMNVPFGAFMPDRAFVPGSTDPMQQHQHRRPARQRRCHQVRQGPHSVRLRLEAAGLPQDDRAPQHWAPLPDQLKLLGINAGDVTKIVIGHGHWDHAGQLMDFPNAVLYVQREELRGIEWALNYPHPKIAAVNTSPGGCIRTPACGYPPKTLDEIYGKVLAGKAVIVDGEMEIAARREDPPGVPRPYRRLAAAGGADRDRQAGVRQRRLLVVGRHPRLDDRQPAADRHRAAVPRLREVLQDHRRLPELRRRARAAVVHGQVPADQELVGRDRMAPGWPRSRSPRARDPASRSAFPGRAAARRGGGGTGPPRPPHRTRRFPP